MIKIDENYSEHKLIILSMNLYTSFKDKVIETRWVIFADTIYVKTNISHNVFQ